MSLHESVEPFRTEFTELAVELLDEERLTLASEFLSNPDDCVRTTRGFEIPSELMALARESVTAPNPLPLVEVVEDGATEVTLVDRAWGDEADPFSTFDTEGVPSAAHRIATVRRWLEIPREAR
ncbi:MAG: hypothetical protein K1X89_02230 [Myxococcaceae bacterium]|nr:hypothetical protein [Myxococcaceae bacterium]